MKQEITYVLVMESANITEHYMLHVIIMFLIHFLTCWSLFSHEDTKYLPHFIPFTELLKSVKKVLPLVPLCASILINYFLLKPKQEGI